MKILVVDDDEVTRDEFGELLQNLDVDVQTTPSGEDALEVLDDEGGDFNVVFTDLKMPGMDGIELMAKIKAEFPVMPVVIITGYATVDTAVTAMKRGAFDYVQKPFKGDQIKELLATLEMKEHFDRSVQSITSTSVVPEHHSLEAFRTITSGRGLVIHPVEDPMEKEFTDAGLEFDSIVLDPDGKGPDVVHPKDLYTLKLRIKAHLEGKDAGPVLLSGLDGLLEYHKWDDVATFLQRIAGEIMNHKSHLVLATELDILADREQEELEDIIAGTYFQSLSESFTNPYRREIIKYLTHHDTASFSDFSKNLEMKDSPKLSFHLRKLVNDGVLDKDRSKNYSLTERGKVISSFIKSLERDSLDNIQNPIILAKR